MTVFLSLQLRLKSAFYFFFAFSLMLLMLERHGCGSSCGHVGLFLSYLSNECWTLATGMKWSTVLSNVNAGAHQNTLCTFGGIVDRSALMVNNKAIFALGATQLQRGSTMSRRRLITHMFN